MLSLQQVSVSYRKRGGTDGHKRGCSQNEFGRKGNLGSKNGRDGSCSNAAFEGDCGKEPFAIEALHDVSLDLAAGESLAVIGPSGCGKSTLLRLASGLLLAPNASFDCAFDSQRECPPLGDEQREAARRLRLPRGSRNGDVQVTGRVLVQGEPLRGPRQQTALILQDFGLIPWKTVYQNAELGLAIRRMPAKERRERTRQALDQVGLLAFERAYPQELSGGMKQRLALARALALDIDLLLMDEPLSALDALLREQLQDTLLRLWRERGYAQVLVTHSIEEAVLLGQRIVVLSARPGTISALVENPHEGTPAFRSSSEFLERCTQVRQVLNGSHVFEKGQQAAAKPVAKDAKPADKELFAALAASEASAASAASDALEASAAPAAPASAASAASDTSAAPAAAMTATKPAVSEVVR